MMDIVYAFCVLFILVGCTRNIKRDNRVTAIDIESKVYNPQKIYLSDLTEGVEYIPLNTSEDIFLRGVYQLSKYKEFLFISDLNNCILYNIDGTFVTKIGRQGSGPGEYRYVSRIVISPAGRLYIQSLSDLLEYDLNGKFIRKYKQIGKPGLWSIQSWLPLNDSLFFGQIPNFSGNEDSRALVYDVYGNIKFEFKNYRKFQPQRIEINNFANQANIYSLNNLVYFKERVNDTLFYLTDKFELHPKYVFNLGNLSIPYNDFFQDKSSNNQFGYINNIFETENYILIDFISNIPQLKRPEPVVEDGIEKWYFTNKILGIYQKEIARLEFSSISKTEDKLSRTGLYNDIDGGPKFYPEYVIEDSILIMTIEALRLKEYVASESFKTYIPKFPNKKKELEMLAACLKETDNPVLVLVTFKK